jgi:hypothetical protein
LKYIIPLLALILILSFIPACAAAEPKVTEEPEAVEEAIEGEPELIWIFEYEDQDSRLHSIAASPDGETLVVGSFLTTYTPAL